MGAGCLRTLILDKLLSDNILSIIKSFPKLFSFSLCQKKVSKRPSCTQSLCCAPCLASKGV